MTDEDHSGPGIATDHLRENLSRRLFGEETGAPVEIGRYAVVERVGAGASGVVFKAFDEELERLVAIKVLSRDATRNEELRQLALREGKTLAKLSHPHVVGIHEVGEQRGSLYFVMELVRGGDLARWIGDRDPSASDHAEQALKLLVEAGEGLWAAHQAGIIHRDFKSANVLVDSDGRAKVADFGLARVEEHGDDDVTRTRESGGGSSGSATTAPGVIAGTRAYLAPERWLGEPASELSDQFAFCVTAWEVLYGRRPWAKRAWADDEAPSAVEGIRLDARIRKALERGLAPDPSDRWPTMGALLETLSPKPSRVPARIGAGVVVVVTLGAFGFAAATRKAPCAGADERIAEIWTDARAAEIEADVTALGLPYADDAWSRFRSEVDTYTEAWATMHRDTCEATVVRKEQSEPVMDLRMACLHEAHQALASTLRAMETVDRDVVVRSHRLLAGLPALGECADLELLQADVRPPEPADAAGVEEARARLADARALRRVSRYEDALAALEAADAAAEKVSYEPLAGELALERGKLSIFRGEFEQSLEPLQAAFASATRWDRPVLGLQAAYELSDANIRLAKNDSAQAFADVASAFALRPNMPPQHVVSAHNQQGAVLRALGKSEPALAAFREGERIATEAFGPRHRETSLPLSNVAAVLYDQGKYDEAIEAYARVLAIRIEQRGPQHPSTALAHNALCTIRVGAGKPDAALPDCRRALEIFQRALPTEHPDIAMAQTNLGNALFDSGSEDEGVAMIRTAVETWVAAVGEDHPNTARGRRALAHSLAETGKLDDARREMQQALRVFEKALGRDHAVVAQTRTSLAQIELDDGRPAEALRMYEQNRALVSSTMGEDHPYFATAELGRGNALAALGRPGEARAAMQTALEIRVERFGEDAEKTQRVREAMNRLPAD